MDACLYRLNGSDGVMRQWGGVEGGNRVRLVVELWWICLAEHVLVGILIGGCCRFRNYELQSQLRCSVTS